MLLRCIPLLEHGRVTGAVVLLRDISELRRRDRLLVSKDATIREIHHRVKNNLQTISSLLRLQGRRLSSPEAKAAIEESVRRIRSIALVHEILSHEAGDDVPFVDIARPLVRMVEEGLLSPEQPIEIKITGDAGNLPATIATPAGGRAQRAAAERGRPRLSRSTSDAGPATAADRTDGAAAATCCSSSTTTATSCGSQVTDDGVGLPPATSPLDAVTGLGLSIVRTLVTTELGGTIEFGAAGGEPAVARARASSCGCRSAPTPIRRARPRRAGRRQRLGDPESPIGSDAQRPPERRVGEVGRIGVRRRRGGGRPPTGGAACGAPPRRCRPRRPSPGWS